MLPDSLDTITIRGFKSIASLDALELRPINILIGANGSGKSNFIGAFAFLDQIREGRLARYVAEAGGAEKILHFGSKSTRELEMELGFHWSGHARWTLAPTAADGLLVVSEGTYYPPRTSEDADRFRPEDQRRNWVVYHVHDTSTSSPVRKTSKVHDNDFLRADASNLAAFLYFLRVKHPGAYSIIRRTIQRVAPFFDDFQLKPLNLNPDDIRLEWRHKDSDQYFDASALSDGTLRFIVLATLFLQPVDLRPSLILVDEPELGLHPYAIGILASMIHSASKESQVIVSTQSSLLLDYFSAEDVLVAERVGSGTSIKRLDSSSLANWLEDYSLGQLWEKNELGGRPGVTN